VRHESARYPSRNPLTHEVTAAPLRHVVTVTATSMVTGNDTYVTRESRLAGPRCTRVLVVADTHDSGAAHVDR
jgi:hypothetical protein